MAPAGFQLTSLFFIITTGIRNGRRNLWDPPPYRRHRLSEVVRRRRSPWRDVLGLKFTGLIDGVRFGIRGRTYVQARVRSARAPHLAAELNEAGDQNIISLFEQQLTLTTAWPGFAFEKVDEERAGCLVGAFVAGSLLGDTAAVLAQLEKGDVFHAIAAFTMARAGEEFAIVQLDQLTAWPRSQASQSVIRVKRECPETGGMRTEAI